MIYDMTAATTADVLKPVVAKDAVLVSEHVYEGFHIENVNAYMSNLKTWLRPFRGVALTYLSSYSAGAAPSNVRANSSRPSVACNPGLSRRTHMKSEQRHGTG